MHIGQTLERAVALWPDREAVVEGTLRLDYRELDERVSRLARSLLALGLGRGAVAATLAPNVHEHLEAYLGCARAAAVLCPVNTRLAAREVAEVLDRSRALVLLAHRGLAELAREAVGLCRRIPRLVWVGAAELALELEGELGYERLLDSAPPLPLPEAPEPSDLAHLYFTSGTTGRPKGVMLTHGNVMTHALAAIAELGLRDSDSWLHAAPLFHLADAWATFAVTWVGGRHVCLPAFEPALALETIERERVTVTNLVPTMLNRMASHPAAPEHDYRSLRLLLSGGAPIAPETVRRVVAVFGCEYVQTYGMTETSPYLTFSIPKAHQRSLPDDEQLRIRSRTGRPMIGVELRVVREDGSEVRPDDAEVGEIVVRGPTVTSGYLDDPAATAEAIVDGWLRTGDLAVVDREGSVSIVDRKKDTIVTGGENVRSIEVENVLHEHPDVLECAVVGAPDPDWGEAVRAVVVLRPGAAADPEALIEHVKARLSRFKAPKAVEFVDELPRTGSGKIAKRVVRDWFRAGAASPSEAGATARGRRPRRPGG